jgi:hypothetical protein
MFSRSYLMAYVVFVFVAILAAGASQAFGITTHEYQPVQAANQLQVDHRDNIWFEDQTHYFEYTTVQELTQRKAVLDLFEVRQGAAKFLGRLEFQDGNIENPVVVNSDKYPYHSVWCFSVERRVFSSEWCVLKDNENGVVQFLQQYH